MSEEETVLDLNEFLGRVQNDNELVFELLDIFVSDFQEKRKLLEEAMEKNDYEVIEHIGHFLKGSCGNISAKALRGIFHELEENGRMRIPLDAKKYLEDIDIKFEELVICIGELRGKLS